jgi:drug efflux transport system permease protein
MLTRIRQLLIKEFLQILRDPRARFALFVPPLIQMLIFGYAASFEVRHVRMAILDLDRSQESRELISRFTDNGYFEVLARLQNRRELADAIDNGRATLAIQILPGFAEALRKGATAPLQVILDGTNSNTALVALGYISTIARRYSEDYFKDTVRRVAPALGPRIPAVVLEERPWFNHDLESKWYFVPSTIGTLILTLLIPMTAFAIVREREIGTLEQLMVTPLSASELIVGKTLPYVLIGLLQLAGVSLIAVFWFDVPFRGSAALLLFGSILFVLSTLAVGLLISTVSKTQQQALVTSFFYIMPAVLLSGFAFPIRSMPHVLQWLTIVDPLRYYLIVVRDSFLKGNGMGVLWPEMSAMAALAAVQLAASVFRFSKTLD